MSVIQCKTVYEGKFVTIVKSGEFQGYPSFSVINKKREVLASIYYYSQWRKYIFMSEDDIVYDLQSLTDIVEYMKILKMEQTAISKARGAVPVLKITGK